MNYKKALLTVGAVGVLGTAGSFGTFAAFTAEESTPVTVSSGTLNIENTFNLGAFENLDASDLSDGTGTNTDLTATAKKAGSIVVENTGSVAQDVYVDFDGPGVRDMSSPYLGSSNVLAENIKVDTSLTGDFTDIGDAGTRLWMLNRRGLSKYLTVDPGETKTLYFRAWLRERSAIAFPDAATRDNGLQGLSIPNQTVTVKATEKDADDYAPVLVDDPDVAGTVLNKNWDFGL